MTNKFYLKKNEDKIIVLYENNEEITRFESVDISFVVTWLKLNILNADIVIL